MTITMFFSLLPLRGYVNVFLSRWQTACDCFKEALTFDPASKVIQSNITVCNFYMGKLKEVWLILVGVVRNTKCSADKV